ncbi:MAG: hypothetical protein EBR15_05975, partial [Gammaproteobacteria bacterium]|nr:hypothetical protein [Gammaproteobacteria bacterium]
QKPEIMGQFVGAIDGMAKACAALDFPIVSGNVSLYNETKNDDGTGSAILPTPAIGGVGVIDDLDKMTTVAFKAPGDVILLVGQKDTASGWLGQSLYLREVAGREEGAPPPVDLKHEKLIGDFVRNLIQAGRVTACHDLSDGGLAVGLTEMALAGNIGCLLNDPCVPRHAGTPLFTLSHPILMHFAAGEYDENPALGTTPHRRPAAGPARLASDGAETATTPSNAAI